MLTCQLRSPDRTFYSGEAVSVTARSPKGEFSILSRHAPLLAELVPGWVRIRTADKELRFACRGGTLSVETDRVVILGSEIVANDEIDLDEARQMAVDAAKSGPEREAAKERLLWLEKLVGDHV